MYAVYSVKGVVRIPPSMFALPLQEAAETILENTFIGYVHPEIGIIVAVFDIDVEEYGRIVPGDGATYHNVVFKILAFRPIEKEVVEGFVSGAAHNVVAFISLGPVDGIVHISQIADEELYYDPQRGAFIGRRTGRILAKGDMVRARIIAVSLPNEPTRRPRIALTMRQPFLGKIDWIKEEVKRIEER